MSHVHGMAEHDFHHDLYFVIQAEARKYVAAVLTTNEHYTNINSD